MKAGRRRIRRPGAAIRSNLRAVEEEAAASAAVAPILPAAAWVPVADLAPHPADRAVAAAPIWEADGLRRGGVRLPSM